MLRTIVRGKRCDIGLGAYSTSNGLAEARREAEKLRTIARAGGDPIEARRKKEDVPTFAEAAATVHGDHSPAWRNQKHRNQWINTLTEYAFPVLGSKRVNDIETSDVLRVLSPIWLAKPETARRVRQRIGAVLDWAKAAGHRSGENPIDGVSRGLPKQSDSKKHHASLPFAKVPGFVEALRASDATATTKRAFELLILTALRTSEVVSAEWSEIDFEEEVWTIPAARMKAKKAHRVPLTPRMLLLLKQAQGAAKQLRAKPDEPAAPFIFPGAKDAKPLSSMAFLMLLRRMEVPVTAHGFRSSFRIWAAEMTSYPREIAELALAHVNQDKTEAAYQRSDLFLKRRKLMEEWTAFVTTPPAVTAQKVSHLTKQA